MVSESEIRQEQLQESYQGGPDLIVEYREEMYLVRSSDDSATLVGKAVKPPYVENGEEVVDIAPADGSIEDEINSILEQNSLTEIGDLAAVEARFNEDSSYDTL